MATAAVPDAPDLTAIAAMVQQLLQRSSYAETDVLTLEEFCRAVKIGRTKLFEVLPKLPVSYALGRQSPRIVWGRFLEYLRETEIDK